MKETANDGLLEVVLVNIGYAFISPFIMLGGLLGEKVIRPVLWAGAFSVVALIVYSISTFMKLG